MDRTQINRWILEGWLFRAAELLYVELKEDELPEERSELDSIMLTYNSMGKFVAVGAKDDKRDEVLDFLKRRLLAVSDAIYREKQKLNGGDQYYTTLRVVEDQRMSDTVFSLDVKEGPARLTREDREIYDGMINTLFERIWVSKSLSEDFDAKLSASSEYLRQVAVSAMTLGLVSFWDITKVRFVLRELSREDASEKYCIRLLFALMTTFHIHTGRIRLFRQELDPLLAKADEVNPLAPLFESLVESYLLATDTDRVTETIEEALPKIIKANQQGGRLNGILQDIEGEDGDPEDQALEEKIRELGKLEAEGADTLFAAFRNFKQLPFFRKIGAWFLPFDPHHSATEELIANNDFVQKLLPFFATRMCDSDLYSAVLSLPYSVQPINYNDPNLSAVLDQMTAPHIEDPKEELARAARSYMQNIYRFFKLYPGQKGNYRFFEELPVSDLSLLAPYVPMDSINNETVLNLMNRGRNNEAALLLKRIIKKNPADVSSLTRLASIHYRRGEYREAVKCYERADLVEDLTSDLRLRLAHAYRRTGDYDKALSIYERFRSQPPVLLSMAATYIAEMKYEEAIPLLHEYIYLAQKPSRAYRSLAWCYFMMGNYEKSGEYYEKIPDMNAGDYLNRIYLSIVQEDFEKAFESSSKLIALQPLDDIIRTMEEDEYILQEKEIKRQTIILLMDSARMLTEKE